MLLHARSPLSHVQMIEVELVDDGEAPAPVVRTPDGLCLVLAHVLEQVEPGARGHVHVQQDEVHIEVLAQEPEPRFGVVRDGDPVGSALEFQTHDASNEGFVVNDEEMMGRRRRP